MAKNKSRKNKKGKNKGKQNNMANDQGIKEKEIEYRHYNLPLHLMKPSPNADSAIQDSQSAGPSTEGSDVAAPHGASGFPPSAENTGVTSSVGAQITADAISNADDPDFFDDSSLEIVSEYIASPEQRTPARHEYSPMVSFMSSPPSASSPSALPSPSPVPSPKHSGQAAMKAQYLMKACGEAFPMAYHAV